MRQRLEIRSGLTSYQIFCDGPECDAHCMMYGRSYRQVERELGPTWLFDVNGDYCPTHVREMRETPKLF